MNKELIKLAKYLNKKELKKEAGYIRSLLKIAMTDEEEYHTSLGERLKHSLSFLTAAVKVVEYVEKNGDLFKPIYYKDFNDVYFFENRSPSNLLVMQGQPHEKDLAKYIQKKHEKNNKNYDIEEIRKKIKTLKNLIWKVYELDSYGKWSAFYTVVAYGKGYECKAALISAAGTPNMKIDPNEEYKWHCKEVNMDAWDYNIEKIREKGAQGQITTDIMKATLKGLLVMCQNANELHSSSVHTK